jgi:hypothetical protein
MSQAVLYDSDGAIKSEIFGPEETLLEYIENSEFSGLFTEDHCSNETHYVDGGEIREKGAQPSESYLFDYQTKSWVWDVALAKSSLWLLIKADRDDEEFGTFTWSTHTFQCDEVSQRRIQGAVQLAQLDSTTTLDWTLADNSVQTFNATELQQIGQALAAHVNACHVKSRTKRVEIDAATTQTELDAIVW